MRCDHGGDVPEIVLVELDAALARSEPHEEIQALIASSAAFCIVDPVNERKRPIQISRKFRC